MISRGSCKQALGNVIQGHSRWARARSPGIFWAGVGNRFVSNTIRHTPDMAIYGGGNQAGEEGGCDNLFQDNTIDRAMFETTDTGVSTTACDRLLAELGISHLGVVVAGILHLRVNDTLPSERQSTRVI